MKNLKVRCMQRRHVVMEKLEEILFLHNSGRAHEDGWNRSCPATHYIHIVRKELRTGRKIASGSHMTETDVGGDLQ